MKFCVFDTEDNSPELEKARRPGYEKEVTLIAGIGHDGEFFHYRPKVKRRIQCHGYVRREMDLRPFYSWLTAQGDDCIAYAHNLGYDLGNVFFRPDDYDITMVGNRIVTARWGKQVFRDTFNLWPMKLDKIGKAVGIEKGTLDVHSLEYVRKDCEITRKAVQVALHMAAEYEVDLPSTLGSFAIRLWQAMGGDNWHCSSMNCKEAYYGGRVELFRDEAQGDIAYTDINSLYPFVMTQKYPTGDELWCGLPNADAFLQRLKSRSGLHGVVRGEFFVPEGELMPLPVETPEGINYPWGDIEGCYTIAEIRSAMRHHGLKVKRVFDAYGSLTAADYYGDFVRHFYEQRKVETDEGRKLMLKLLMNNLYGQLGMSGIVTRSLLLENNLEDTPEGPRLKRAGTPYGSRLLADIQMPLPEHCNYLHAAHVTSYARLELLKYLRLIPAHRRLYCDTDSVFFLAPGYKIPFPIGKELGEMKLEAEATHAILRGPKMYHLKQRDGKKIWKAKGVPTRKIDGGDMTYSELFHRDGRVTYLQPFRLREHILFFNDQEKDGYDNTARINGVWREVEKTRKTDYTKKSLHKGRYLPKKNEPAETSDWDWL